MVLTIGPSSSKKLADRANTGRALPPPGRANAQVLELQRENVMATDDEKNATYNDLMPTFAFEIQNAEHERKVRAFLEGGDIDYYFLAATGKNEGVCTHGVIVVHTGDFVALGQLLVPRGQ
jgi:hypothetical protein